MEIAEQLKKSIADALVELGAEGVSFTLEHPADLAHGDYATNAALVASKILQKNPKEVASELVAILDPRLRGDDGVVESIEIAGPGFINFKLSKSFFSEAIPGIISDESFGSVKIHSGKKILVEHSSPNLFKPFHIGHMMNNAIGESLVRLMRASGANVETMSFPSDLSLGIGKAIWYLLNKETRDVHSNEYNLEQKLGILGNAYVEGTKAYEDTPEITDEVKRITDILYAGTAGVENDLYHFCKDLNMKYFEQEVLRLGSTFDSYIYEGEAGEVGKKLVKDNTPDVFTESEGALIYVPEESKKHLNTEVFVNSQGNPTYGAKDLGLLDLKFKKDAWDLSITITDYQQGPHFAVVLDAAAKINQVWADRSAHVPHGRMAFKGQKMSSRLGGVPLASEVLQTILEEVHTLSTDRNIPQETEDQIAIAAIKFSILRAKPGSPINFDPETSLSFEGDSGPYLQYTHARISSLLEKGAGLGISPKYLANSEISDLEKILYRLPEIVENAITDYSPNYIVTYLLEIAHAFNGYYGANKIVDETDTETSAHRLAIAHATQVILRNGLNLLGISAPDKM